MVKVEIGDHPPAVRQRDALVLQRSPVRQPPLAGLNPAASDLRLSGVDIGLPVWSGYFVDPGPPGRIHYRTEMRLRPQDDGVDSQKADRSEEHTSELQSPD